MSLVIASNQFVHLQSTLTFARKETEIKKPQILLIRKILQTGKYISPAIIQDEAHVSQRDRTIESLIDLIDCICARWRLHMLNRQPYRSLGRGMSRGFVRNPTDRLPTPALTHIHTYEHIYMTYTRARPRSTLMHVIHARVRTSAQRLTLTHVWPPRRQRWRVREGYRGRTCTADCHLSSRLICHVLRYGDASDVVIIKMRISNNLRRI